MKVVGRRVRLGVVGRLGQAPCECEYLGELGTPNAKRRTRPASGLLPAIRCLGHRCPDFGYGRDPCVTRSILLDNTLGDPVGNPLAIARVYDLPQLRRIRQICALAENTRDFRVTRKAQPAPRYSDAGFAGFRDDVPLDAGSQAVAVGVPEKGLYSVRR